MISRAAGWFVVFMVLIGLTLAPFLRTAQAQVAPGVWSGFYVNSARVRVKFTITISERETGEMSGTISIPAMNLVDHPLQDVAFDSESISFALPEQKMVFQGQPNINRTRLFGTVNINGAPLPFQLSQGDGEAPVEEGNPIDLGPQRWKGVAELPGLNLEFLLELAPSPTPSGWGGTIDIPLQGVKGMPLKEVTVGREIRFTIKADSAAAPPAAKFLLRAVDADHYRGAFTQAGSVFNVSLSRVTDPNFTLEPPRPQTPEPPFPYTERDIEYRSAVDGARLAGTLTIPEGEGPHPAILMISGSGPQDRNETIAGHKPFLVIADALSRQGIAVLRVDDRGVGDSEGDVMSATSATNIADVLAGVQWLKGQNEIDARRIGLLGHSEGGWIAPIAASESSDVAFLVLLAAPGVSGRELLLMQRDLMRSLVGATPEQREKESAMHAALLDAIESHQSREAITEALRQLAIAESEGAPEAEEYAAKVTAAQAPSLDTAWFRDVLTLDSRAALRKLTIPILAITGERDRQVPPTQNMAEIQAALDAAGNTRSKLVILPELNHLLQASRSGMPNEYVMLQETISPTALDEMVSWLRLQTGLADEPTPDAGP